MNILLDTCAFFWMISAPERLSPLAVRSIQEADTVYLSAISIWEILTKQQKSHVDLGLDPKSTLLQAAIDHKVSPLYFSFHDAFEMTTLPLIHRDPFDRMLICQSITNKLPMVTSDRNIAQYPVRVIW